MDATMLQTVINSDSFINGVFLLVGGIVTGLITYFTVKGMNKANALKSITEAVNNLLGPLNDRVDRQDEEIKKLKNKVSTLERAVRISRTRIMELGEIIRKLMAQVFRLGDTPEAELPHWMEEFEEEGP